MSIDVNGNDNAPEWGYCTEPGCQESAFPIWESGDFPDDPDHLLCSKHLGLLIRKLDTQRKNWTEIGARAEADAGALRHALIHGLGLANELGEGERWADWRLSTHTILNQDAGAALLAELEAARSVIEAARTGFGTEEDIRRAYAFDPNLLTARIRVYDAVVKRTT